jgi:ABC-type phosphate/phosphonate transport system substrate-binding protein
LNVGRTAVQSARVVLDGGTAHEIEAVERGDATAEAIATEIRKKASLRKTQKYKKEDAMSERGKNPARIARQRMNAEIWGRIKDALMHLTAADENAQSTLRFRPSGSDHSPCRRSAR